MADGLNGSAGRFCPRGRSPGSYRVGIARVRRKLLISLSGRNAHPVQHRLELNMERSFKTEVEALKLGAGATFRGEGILAVTKALLQSGVRRPG
jgi:hypothetical protein